MTPDTMKREEVQFAIAQALNDAPPVDDQQLDRLALFSPIEYGNVRMRAAQELEIPVTFLDKAIADRKKQLIPAAKIGNGRGLELPTIELAHTPVSGLTMFDMVLSVLTKYVVLPDHAAFTIALWIIRAHCDDAFNISPRLGVLSPVKRCGKTTLLELIAKLVPRPLSASNITASVIFRTIEKYHPTLLIDEADSFLSDNEELRGILNSGHRRDSAHVLRNVGDDHEPRMFSTWSPMVIAGIGTLPETIEDRSIVVSMRRKRPDETVFPLRWNSRHGETVRKQLATIASALARWAFDHGSDLRNIEPVIPDGLHDRAADNWYPLLTIAEEIGGYVVEQARAAAVALSSGETGTESNAIELLKDIAVLLETEHGSRISSQTLCDQLALMEERPWSEWRRGQPLSAIQLARLLKGFGIKSRSIRFDSGVQRGYERGDFSDAFERNLSASRPKTHLSSCNTATTRSHSNESKLFQSATDLQCSTSENASSSSLGADCSTVALQTRKTEPEEVIDLVG
jgi:putative DNA primase/helicase